LKIAHLIAKFLAENGIKRVYTVSGGGDLHMIDAICKRDDIRIICPQNEQGASFAADCEARIVGIGCAMATSGPGATNFVTGIATSYYDSVPVLYLTGNQTRARLGTGLGVRQFGFQSMPFVELTKSITKYSVIVMKEDDILYELEKALWYAKEGRPGPVVVDVPDDIQRAEVDPLTLRHFSPPKTESTRLQKQNFSGYKRPVLALGWGVHLSGGREVARETVSRLNIPCVTTWGAADIMAGHPLYVGTWGTHGVRAANFAVQNADLVISVGSRLDTKATGSPASSFAPKADLTMVDIDQAELDKMNVIGRPCYTVKSDAVQYLKSLEVLDTEQSFGSWRKQVFKWAEEYPAIDPDYPTSSPYKFMEQLGTYLTEDDLVVSDTGCPLAWAMQTIPFKGRFIHAFNQTPMGYGLPASMGASGAFPGRVVLLTGDGGLSENITEFATIRKHDMDIKTILFNNKGHAMCRQTQKQWLGGVYHGTSSKDLATPNFKAVANAYGISVVNTLPLLFKQLGPAFLEVLVDEEQGVVPQVRFGKSIEDADPALPEKVLKKIMEVGSV